MNDTIQNVYGCINTLPVSPSYHAERGFCRKVDWTTPGLRITRLRLLSDPGFPAWDVSYCHGTLNGETVDVLLPFSQLPKRGMFRAIVAHAAKSKVYAKGLGIFDCISTCN